MKKIIIFIIAIAILGGIVWRFNSGTSSDRRSKDDANATATTSIPASKTVEVSNKLSEYKNDELGFSVKYPTTWERTESPTGVNLVSVVDSKIKHTIGNIETKIDIISGKCAFPPVTTIKERDTLTVGDLKFSMISIANTIQNRNFFSRMYSLQKGSVCYFFTLSTITSSPTSKGLTGADAQKASANNTTLVDQADSQFKDMVKSFKFLVSAVGEDEAKIAPKK
jgi:hypothetical protein